MKLTKDIIRKLIKEELLTERDLGVYDMVDKYRELQRRLWHYSTEGMDYNMWRLQTAFNVKPEEAKAKVEKHAKEMKEASDLSVDVIKNELEDDNTRIAFVNHIRDTVKNGMLARDPKNQLMSDQDMWTPESGQVPDYEENKKHLETKR